jgi:hypothetical protein
MSILDVTFLWPHSESEGHLSSPLLYMDKLRLPSHLRLASKLLACKQLSSSYLAGTTATVLTTLGLWVGVTTSD